VSEHDFYEEEEFTTQFNGETLRRIAGQLKPYWPWVLGFLSLIVAVSALDSYFTYLSSRLIDEGIIAKDTVAASAILIQYASLILIQAISVFGFIYMTGYPGREGAIRPAREHVHPLAEPIPGLLQQDAGGLDHLARDVRYGSCGRAGYLGNARCDMGHRQHRDIHVLHVANQPPVDHDCRGDHPDHRCGGSRVQKAHPGPVSRRAPGQFQDHGALQRDDHRCPGHQGFDDGERANQEEFQELTGEMYEAGYRAAWLSALFLPTVQLIAAFAVGAVILYSGVQANTGSDSMIRGRYPGLHLLHHLHALADQRDGPRLCRHAVGHRLR
jgi:ATP-binding cassette subfamily B protein